MKDKIVDSEYNLKLEDIIKQFKCGKISSSEYYDKLDCLETETKFAINRR